MSTRAVSQLKSVEQEGGGRSCLQGDSTLPCVWEGLQGPPQCTACISTAATKTARERWKDGGLGTDVADVTGVHIESYATFSFYCLQRASQTAASNLPVQQCPLEAWWEAKSCTLQESCITLSGMRSHQLPTPNHPMDRGCCSERPPITSHLHWD